MEFSARQIAELLNGEVEGNPNQLVSQLSRIEEGSPNSLSFLANPKYTEYIYSTGASIVIVNKEFLPEKPVPNTCTLIKVEDAYQSFAQLLDIYNKQRHAKTGIHPNAFVDETARIGENVFVGANASIGENAIIEDDCRIYEGVTVGANCRIGKGTMLYPGVHVLYDCEVGNSCTLQPGVIIGGDGFGFAPNQENQYNKVPQIGNVIIHDHVEIGANTTVDRATMGSTIIHKGVKLDNLIQIAHNVEIGENTVIAAQTGVAGSTKIGRDCMIGGQVGIIGHLKIADGVKIAAQSGIGQDIDEQGTMVQGSPAFEIGPYKRSYVGFRNLPKLQQKLNELEKELASLKASMNG